LTLRVSGLPMMQRILFEKIVHQAATIAK